MTEIDLSKLSPGSFAMELLSGAPVDFFLDLMYRRAGIPQTHSLRAALVYTHPSDDRECPRLPSVFPPDDWASRTKSGKLQSVQDWLDLVNSVDTTPRPREFAKHGGIRGFPAVTVPEPAAPSAPEQTQAPEVAKATVETSQAEPGSAPPQNEAPVAEPPSGEPSDSEQTA